MTNLFPQTQISVNNPTKLYLSFHIPSKQTPDIIYSLLTSHPLLSQKTNLRVFVFNHLLPRMPEKLSPFIHSGLIWLNRGNCHTPKFSLPILTSFGIWLMTHMHTLTLIIYHKTFICTCIFQVTSLIQWVLIILNYAKSAINLHGLGFYGVHLRRRLMESLCYTWILGTTNLGCSLFLSL